LAYLFPADIMGCEPVLEGGSGSRTVFPRKFSDSPLWLALADTGILKVNKIGESWAASRRGEPHLFLLLRGLSQSF